MQNTALMAALAMTVVGQVGYHLIARGASGLDGPVAMLAVAYGVAAVITSAIALLTGQVGLRLPTTSTLLWGIGFGLSVALIEIGYIYSYRAGLSVSRGPLIAIGLATLALIPFGVMLFREEVSISYGIGVVLTFAGIWLMIPR